MGGGLLQLVAYGAQDAYLSGNPQITFWKGLFKRHTNFAMEPFRVNLSGQPGWGVKHSAIVGRHADLLYSTYLEVVLPPGELFNNDCRRLGYNLIKYVELDIGGQVIDRLYGEWLFLWDMLSNSFDKRTALEQAVGLSFINPNSSAIMIPNVDACANGRPATPVVVYVPLTFFYTKNPGAALPLIALQYHEVKINIQWNDAKFVAGNFNNAKSLKAPVQAAVYVDYIYLDTEERRRMAQQSHEYLIEQTQFNEDQGVSSANVRIDLTFNHPVKELVWVVQPESYTNCSLAIDQGYDQLYPFSYDWGAIYEQTLQINGQDRLDKRYGDYFHTVQPLQHHTGAGPAWDAYDWKSQFDIYCYSFALRPEEHQPSGTCNFSRIDTATLVMSFAGQNGAGGFDIDVSPENPWNVRVYALSYNILRIMSGMGGLAYSN